MTALFPLMRDAVKSKNIITYCISVCFRPSSNPCRLLKKVGLTAMAVAVYLAKTASPGRDVKSACVEGMISPT